jgi:hypothetical protein
MVTNPNNNSYLFPNDFNGPLGSFTQAPSASTAYTLDYSDWLATGVSIANVSYVVTPTTVPALVVTNSMIVAIGAAASEGITFQVSGGVAGQRYTVAPTVTLTDGSAKTDQFLVSCVALQGTQLGVSSAAIASGANFLGGIGAPTSADGSDGDFYLDTAASLVYGPKTSGAWPSPAAPFGGANFLAGNSGGVAPSNSIGANGSFFIDMSSGLVFGPKAAGVWPSSGGSITSSSSANTITGNSGGAAPSNTIGANTNYFLDMSSGLLFGPKAAGAWPATGVAVDPANLIYGNSSGSAPSNSIGLNGDYFLDLSSGKVFGPKATGAWPASTGSIYPLLTNAGAANGVATLDSTGHVPLAQLKGVLAYQGGWNASTNTPTLASGVGTQGNFYEVTTAGATTLDGSGPWAVNDLVWFDGTKWGRIGSNAGGTNGQSTLAQGRLTLTSGSPVLSAAVLAATTIYYTPYNGNLVPVWNGSAFISTVFTEMSQSLTDTTKSPGAAAASNVYDMFVWNNSGTLRCTRGPAWQAGGGSNTLRGSGPGSTALTRVNGVLVNANAITNGPAAGAGTYVGTIMTDTSGATVTFQPLGGSLWTTIGSLPVWNMYNRVSQYATIEASGGTYTYSSASARVAQGNSNNSVVAVSGLPEDTALGFMFASGQTVAVSGASISFYIGDAALAVIVGPVAVKSVGAVANNGTLTPAGSINPFSGKISWLFAEQGDGVNANMVQTYGNETMTIVFRM